ncbi:MAG TPA: D-arabinono-1,4-lactone oxidase [Jiangellaceae bacterium]|nr:D-arabinono-1,4-lactone oxidase [Jiangellaceae bacterium]
MTSTGAPVPRARPRPWRNWARTVEGRPTRVAVPFDAAEVAATMVAAGKDGLRVKPVGSGHSFTPVAVTDGVQVRLERLTGLLDIDVDPASGRGLATVAAGTPLLAFNADLARHGLGLANMGDIAVQTVSGAVATGTHGTGREVAALAEQIAGLEIALPDGSLVRCSAGHEPDLFQAARLGLGALGVVTALTFRVEPAFLLHAVDERGSLAEILDRFDDYAAGEHVEFHWLPFTDAVQLKRNSRTSGPARPLGRFRARWEGDVVENLGIGLVQRVTRAVPRWTPLVNGTAAGLISRRDYVDAAPVVFSSVRRVRFHEMEYALPRGVAVAVLQEFRRITDEGPWRISFPVQVRLAPADDVWLSTAYGRDTVYVACHAYPRTDYGGWFAAAEDLFVSFGGRPHWGKLHTRDAAYLRGVYPRLDEFRAVRDRVDPGRLMANGYLRRVLGP